MVEGDHLFGLIWRTVATRWFWMEATQRLGLLVVFLALVRLLTTWVYWLIHRFLRNRIHDQRFATLASMVESLVWYAIVLVVVLTGLHILGLPTSHLLTGLGIGGLALALGVQNLVRDLISGSAILVENSMQVGDHVVLNANEFLSGEVLEMGARVVKIRDDEGRTHHVAYSSLTSISNLPPTASGRRGSTPTVRRSVCSSVNRSIATAAGSAPTATS